ncbi:MAG TPA: glycine cleavage system protein GcvH [Candidatus Binatia bacterium]|nr:glycine cleavage system protein GcvH [Candidatus Binatia bacterium]
MADTLKFTEDHLWVRVEGSRAHVGISDYGQNELGEVIAVELPDVGDELEKGEPFGEIESVRTVSELLSPLGGTVTAINSDLDDHPRIVNEDPYHEGWLVEIELADETELEDLMDSDEYEEYASGESEG